MAEFDEVMPELSSLNKNQSNTGVTSKELDEASPGKVSIIYVACIFICLICFALSRNEDLLDSWF